MWIFISLVTQKCFSAIWWLCSFQISKTNDPLLSSNWKIDPLTELNQSKPSLIHLMIQLQTPDGDYWMVHRYGHPSDVKLAFARCTIRLGISINDAAAILLVLAAHLVEWPVLRNQTGCQVCVTHHLVLAIGMVYKYHRGTTWSINNIIKLIIELQLLTRPLPLLAHALLTKLLILLRQLLKC